MGSEIRRVALIDGKVTLLQDIRNCPFKAIKNQKHCVATRKDIDTEKSRLMFYSK